MEFFFLCLYFLSGLFLGMQIQHNLKWFIRSYVMLLCWILIKRLN